MTDLDRLLTIPRARNLLRDMCNEHEYRMPCGDSRIAMKLLQFGAIRLMNRERREVTTSWELTDLGRTKVLCL